MASACQESRSESGAKRLSNSIDDESGRARKHARTNSTDNKCKSPSKNDSSESSDGSSSESVDSSSSDESSSSQSDQEKEKRKKRSKSKKKKKAKKKSSKKKKKSKKKRKKKSKHSKSEASTELVVRKGKEKEKTGEPAMADWTVDQVFRWAARNVSEDCALKLRQNQVTGRVLAGTNDAELIARAYRMTEMDARMLFRQISGYHARVQLKAKQANMKMAPIRRNWDGGDRESKPAFLDNGEQRQLGNKIKQNKHWATDFMEF